MRNNARYIELAKAKVQERRNLVVSSFIDNGEPNGFTIAQQIEVDENGKKFSLFLKDSFHIDSVEGLYALRDALNLAIAKYNEAKENKEEWDN